MTMSQTNQIDGAKSRCSGSGCRCSSAIATDADYATCFVTAVASTDHRAKLSSAVAVKSTYHSSGQ